MNFEQRYRNSKILFGISLLFLVVFLAVWLQNIYQDKIDELQTEVSYLWLKSIKEVENKEFSKRVITSVTNSIDWSSIKQQDTSVHTLIKKIIIDTAKTNLVTDSFLFVNQKEEISVEFSIDSTPFPFLTQQKGNINLQIPPLEGSVNTIMENIEQGLTFILKELNLDEQLLAVKLDSQLLATNIPIQYNILYLKDSIDLEDSHRDRFFIETATGSKYSLKMQHYPSYICQEMWFEFLMGLLLLAIITIAFYYILNNLKEQNRLVSIKNDLISNITHELRTPIFTVSAALEALESFNGLEDPTRTKEYISISKNELNRLSILVEKVLKSSLFEQDTLQINPEVFLLSQLIATIANSLQLQLEKQNASLDITAIPPTLQVYADKIHLTNVIYNLIDNALKYSADRPPIIHIKSNTTEQTTQIIVSDNGKGISEEYLDQIFNKFFRVPEGNLHQIKGYGLGLNYVQNIIQQHHGTITVSSTEGQGTEFIISLPKASNS